MEEPLRRELYKPHLDVPISRVRVSDGEVTVEMDAAAYSMSESDLRYLFDMYRDL